MKVCQNEVLSEGRQLMKWVGIFLIRIFWVAIFRVGIFQRGRSWWVGIFRVGIVPGVIFLEQFSSCNVSVLIFQKIINKYNKTFNKNIYFKLIKYRAKFPSCNFLFKWTWNIFKSKHIKQWKFWVVNKWEVREKCKS